jgi:hypothetical protein
MTVQHRAGGGKEYLLYAALLDRAHQSGLRRIATTLLQAPDEGNGFVAIVTAQVETDRGVFDGIGDANPQNVNRSVASHLIRMAETRAKARALRDAVNLGEDDFVGDGADLPSRHSPAGAPAGFASWDQQLPTRTVSDAEAPVEFAESDGVVGEPASASEYQLATIQRLERLLGVRGDSTAELSAIEASSRISELAQAFNDRRRPGEKH